MAQPVLIINGHDYAPLVEELNITNNDLDAEGSGRDVQTGLMHRKRVATKLKAEVRLLDLPQSVHRQLLGDIGGEYYSATVLDPVTGGNVTKRFYTSTVPFGAQRYDRYTGAPKYSGMTFNMTER